LSLGRIVLAEVGNVWKKETVVFAEVIAWDLSVGTEDNHENRKFAGWNSKLLLANTIWDVLFCYAWWKTGVPPLLLFQVWLCSCMFCVYNFPAVSSTRYSSIYLWAATEPGEKDAIWTSRETEWNWVGLGGVEHFTEGRIRIFALLLCALPSIVTFRHHCTHIRGRLQHGRRYGSNMKQF
jgi:hypothetical protein